MLPLWGGLWLLRRVRFRELLWFPAAYAATCVPALLLGKPLGMIERDGEEAQEGVTIVDDV